MGGGGSIILGGIFPRGNISPPPFWVSIRILGFTLYLVFPSALWKEVYSGNTMLCPPPPRSFFVPFFLYVRTEQLTRAGRPPIQGAT